MGHNTNEGYPPSHIKFGGVHELIENVIRDDLRYQPLRGIVISMELGLAVNLAALKGAYGEFLPIQKPSSGGDKNSLAASPRRAAVWRRGERCLDEHSQPERWAATLYSKVVNAKGTTLKPCRYLLHRRGTHPELLSDLAHPRPTTGL